MKFVMQRLMFKPDPAPEKNKINIFVLCVSSGNSLNWDCSGFVPTLEKN